MRTFDRETFDRAQRLWTDGNFADDWKVYRHQAAMRGMIFPPDGTEFDSVTDDPPSQRAMLFRAIRDTPTLLHEAIARSRSWGQVLEFILKRRDEWRTELDERARDTARHREDEPDGRQASASLKGILDRIGDS